MAIENAGGLAAVETPSTAANAVQGAAQEYTAGAPVKSNIKGAPFGTGNVVLDPRQTAELLANMQEMIAQKTGGFNQFMSGLKDAAAWAVPGISGQKQLALASRDEQKRAEMQDVFNMRSQMASLQSAQAQAEADAKRAGSFIGGGTPGSNVVGGAVGTFESLPPEEQQRILMARPSEQYALIQDALKRQGEARLKGTFEAAGNKQETYFVPGVGNVQMTPNQFRDLPPEVKTKIQQATLKRFGSLPEAAGAAPQVRPQGNAAEIAQGLGIPVISGYRSPEKQAELYAESQKPGYAGPPVAKPGSSQHQQGNAIDVDSRKLTSEQRQTLISNGFTQPLPKTDPNHWELQGARGTQQPYQVAGTAPVAPPKPVQAPTAPAAPAAPKVSKMPNPADFNSPVEFQAALKQFEQEEEKRRGIETKQAEANISMAAKSGEKISEDTGKMMGALIHGQKDTADIIRTADRVIKHATTYPKEFGYAYQQENPMLAGAANIPGVGAIVEKAVPAMFGSAGESNRRSQTDTDANKLGLDFAAQMFSGTGARLGVGLEQMAANAKGVGTQFPASVNALNANLVKVAAEKGRDIVDLWGKWSPNHGGKSADVAEFMQTPEYKALEKDWDKKFIEFDNKLKKQFPDVYAGLIEEEPKKKDRKPLNAILGGQ